MNSQTINSLYNFLPELSLALLIIISNALSVLLKGREKVKYFSHAAFLLVVFSLTLPGVYTLPQTAFNGLMVIDNFAYAGKVLIALSSFVFFALFYGNTESSSEFTLLSTLTLGAMLAVGSSDLIMLFISLEAMSISIYILITPERSIALKYYVYGVTSSSIMLLGISLMFGICSSTGYYGISDFLSRNSFNPLTLSVSLLLILTGIGFRMMLFPFNFYMPTLAEKIPVRKLAFISITGVLTLSIVLLRFLLTVLHDGNSFITGTDTYIMIQGINWPDLISVVSACSMIAGSTVILWQRNLKKIFAFLLLYQAGNLLIGLPSASAEGTIAVLFNLVVLLIQMTGILFCLGIFEQRFRAVTIDDLKQKGKSSPILFFSFLFFISSIAGLPLTAGFSGRMLLVFASASNGLFWLPAISIITSMVIFYFIFRLMHEIFSGKTLINEIKLETHHKFILLVILLPAILLGFYLTPVINWVKFGSVIFGIMGGN